MRKRIYLILTVLAATSFTVANAQQTAEITSSGIGYLQYLPEGYHGNTKQYPLVISLHGIKEKGTSSTDPKLVIRDLPRVDNVGLPKYASQGKKFPFILISPQLKSNYGSWSPEFIIEVLNYVKKKLRIDNRRVYLTGLSLGGLGVWKTAGAYPKVFAAIAPVCSGGNAISKAAAIAHEDVAVWAFHGASDKIVSYTVTTSMVDAINRSHPNPLAKVTLFPGMNHSIWDKAYLQTDLLDWMLRFKNGAPPPEDTQSKDDPSDKDEEQQQVADQQQQQKEEEERQAQEEKAQQQKEEEQRKKQEEEQKKKEEQQKKEEQERQQKEEQERQQKAEQERQEKEAQEQKQKEEQERKQKEAQEQKQKEEQERKQKEEQERQQQEEQRKQQEEQERKQKEEQEQQQQEKAQQQQQAQAQREEAAQQERDDEQAPNIPPIANAGPDQTVMLRAGSFSLYGQADDNDGTIATYHWRQLSGPGASMSGATSRIATVSGLTDGVYVFRLEVTDNRGARSVDDVTVQVRRPYDVDIEPVGSDYNGQDRSKKLSFRPIPPQGK